MPIVHTQKQSHFYKTHTLYQQYNIQKVQDIH